MEALCCFLKQSQEIGCHHILNLEHFEKTRLRNKHGLEGASEHIDGPEGTSSRFGVWFGGPVGRKNEKTLLNAIALSKLYMRLTLDFSQPYSPW